MSKIKIFLISFLLQTSPALAYHIMLDPGHGGMDTGAVRGPAKEADLVLKVATHLKKILENEPGIQVSLTRSNDSNLNLQERVKKADSAKADLFVSLHANAASDSRARGVEFFFQNTLPPDEESLFLASVENQNMNEFKKSDFNKKNLYEDDPSKKGDVAAIIEDLHRQHRLQSSLEVSKILAASWSSKNQNEKLAIKQAPFYVISNTNMPSVLIEIGFLTNQHDVKKLMTENYQKEVAEKIRNALVEYKEKSDKGSPSVQNKVQ